MEKSALSMDLGLPFGSSFGNDNIHSTLPFLPTVLRAHLLTLILTTEFHTSYAQHYDTLTASPLPPPNKNIAPPVITDDYPGPSSLPPLTRALYVRLLRSLPLFANQGERYLEEFDKFFDKEWVAFVGAWMRATRFDVLVCFLETVDWFFSQSDIIIHVVYSHSPLTM